MINIIDTLISLIDHFTWMDGWMDGLMDGQPGGSMRGSRIFVMGGGGGSSPDGQNHGCILPGLGTYHFSPILQYIAYA